MQGEFESRVEYLKSLLNIEFYGACDDTKTSSSPLGPQMKQLHQNVLQGKVRSKEVEILLQNIAQLRKDIKAKSNDNLTKFTRNFECFLKLREEREFLISREIEREEESFCALVSGVQTASKPVDQLTEDEFWGNSQQLLGGKIVGDSLGGIDPVFGALLNPTGGMVGPGSCSVTHSLLYRDGNAFSYHAAVHDACGYLLTYHGLGPGYNYLGHKWTFHPTNSFFAGQYSGYMFFRDLIKRNAEENIVVTYY
ncbi:uncharacterized protein LOC116616022 [Nematostella vectensis]|uniref:uncharacterized protein LOC116616022 n=1 Tax=Nematostella vectensis TaxID=45351 RepID=UPI0020776692|nr:uncharacterized protein LOC116616022 [Nematostella vectensis]